MANLALITADTTHAAATNTKAALEGLGHTVTAVLDGSSTLGTVDPANYDIAVTVRTSSSISDAIGNKLWEFVDAGKPVVIGMLVTALTGTGIRTVADYMGLIGTAEILTSAQDDSQEITDNSHTITSSFAIGNLVTNTGANFAAALDEGASYVGVSLANGDPSGVLANQKSLIAIETGTQDLAATKTTNARIVIWGHLYAGQSDYTGNGKFILKRCLNWALGVTEAAINNTTGAAWNPLDKGDHISVINNDLTAYHSNATVSEHGIRALLGKSAGKWYFEVSADVVTASTGGMGFGLATVDPLTTSMFTHPSGLRGYLSTGQKVGSSGNPFGDTYSSGAIIGVAVDLDVGKIWFSKNGVWQASGDPAGGTNPAFADMAIGVEWYPYAYLTAQNDQGSTRFDEGRLFSAPPTGFSVWVAGSLLSGTVTEAGASVARTVRAYRRDTGVLLAEQTSAADGTYSFTDLGGFTGEVYVIALDDDASHNDLVYDRIVVT